MQGLNDINFSVLNQDKEVYYKKNQENFKYKEKYEIRAELSTIKLLGINASAKIYFEESKPKNYIALIKSIKNKYEDKIDRSN